MVPVRLNEKEANPNPHINYITALPVNDAAQEEDARQLLRALAAQVRPVMKNHGFVVNRFEEVRVVALEGEDCELMRRIVSVQQGVLRA